MRARQKLASILGASVFTKQRHVASTGPRHRLVRDCRHPRRVRYAVHGLPRPGDFRQPAHRPAAVRPRPRGGARRPDDRGDGQRANRRSLGPTVGCRHLGAGVCGLHAADRAREHAAGSRAVSISDRTRPRRRHAERCRAHFRVHAETATADRHRRDVHRNAGRRRDRESGCGIHDSAMGVAVCARAGRRAAAGGSRSC